MAVEQFYDPGPTHGAKYRGSENLSFQTVNWNLLSSGSMASLNHPLPLNTEVDSGGDWLMIKTIDVCSPGKLRTPKFVGDFTVGKPKDINLGLWISPHPTDALLKSQGTTAIARTTPNNPAYNVPQFLGELREGLPSIIGSGTLKDRTRLAKSAGGEYLNIEFGWKPGVSDLRNFASTVQSAHQIWDAYRKGSNHKTRVGYHYPLEEDVWTYSGLVIPIPVQFPHGFPSASIDQVRERQTWFKGAFRYYVPEPVGFADKMHYWYSQSSKILGLRLTPDTVWNLEPWSWAADWFANTGDLMTNVSNMGQDGLVLQYGYAMSGETLTTRYLGNATFTYPSTGPGATHYSAGTVRTTVNKRAKRLHALPYGFDATLSTLSTRQIAIVAALGLSFR
jgi:hypothetical protein